MRNGAEGLRLLPWAGPEGKPCYLSGDGTGYVSRVADNMEAAQLDVAAELIDEAKCVLAGRAWTPGELHLLAVQLTESLGDVYRVAESRGARLPAPAYDDLGEVNNATDVPLYRPRSSSPTGGPGLVLRTSPESGLGVSTCQQVIG